MLTQRIARVLAWGLIAAGLIGMATPAQAFYVLQSSDSATLSSAGDTQTISYSEPIDAILIRVLTTGSSATVMYATDQQDATEADFPLKDSDDPLFLKNLHIDELDLRAANANASEADVHVRAYIDR